MRRTVLDEFPVSPGYGAVPQELSVPELLIYHECEKRDLC